jgi:hypothetical protein
MQSVAPMGSQYHQDRTGQFSVEIPHGPVSREGVYIDDTRNVKRAKLEPRRISFDIGNLAAPKEIAPKETVPKVLYNGSC